MSLSSSTASRKRGSDTVVVAPNMSSSSFVAAATSRTSTDITPNIEQPSNDGMMMPISNTKHTTALPPPKPIVRLKVRVKRFHGVAAWSWNANDDVCGICQSAFENTAPGVKYPGEDCPVVWGKCGHAYHLQCVSKWLSQPSSKNSCPICRQEWEFGQNPVNTDATGD